MNTIHNAQRNANAAVAGLGEKQRDYAPKVNREDDQSIFYPLNMYFKTILNYSAQSSVISRLYSRLLSYECLQLEINYITSPIRLDIPILIQKQTHVKTCTNTHISLSLLLLLYVIHVYE